MPVAGRNLAPGGRLTLAPASASASAARRWLVEQLAGYPDGLTEDAELLLSEVVTNAVLHAGTTIEVAIFSGDRVRIEVADGSPVLPAAKNYVADAATGRGLLLLEAMAAAWGVDQGASGKVVWFELSPGERDATVAGPDFSLADLDAWPDSDWSEAAGAAGAAGGPAAVELVRMRLIGMPLKLLKWTSEQYDALFRELRLIVARDVEGVHTIPRRLMALGDEVTSQYSSFTVSTDAELQAAMARGDETIDLDYRLPPDVGPASAHYDELLDEGDEWCLAGRELLTLAPKPPAVALRKWILEEMVRQAAGQPPIAWPDSRWAAAAG